MMCNSASGSSLLVLLIKGGQRSWQLEDHSQRREHRLVMWLEHPLDLHRARLTTLLLPRAVRLVRRMCNTLACHVSSSGNSSFAVHIGIL